MKHTADLDTLETGCRPQHCRLRHADSACANEYPDSRSRCLLVRLSKSGTSIIEAKH